MKRRTRIIILSVIGLVALTIGVCTGLIVNSVAHASTILPVPTSLDYGRTLAINDTGAQLIHAFTGNNSPGNCSGSRPGSITQSGNSAVLTSNGNDCEFLESPHMYPTVHGYVYEESVTVSQWTTWQSFWAFGNNWPVDGEIDNIEASPTGQNNISWHDSTSAPTGFSTCNNQDGCDGNADPITQPSNAESIAHGLAPGTHIIDFAFGGTGVISVWYDGQQAAWLQTSQAIGGANDNPFWIVDSNGTPENGQNTGGAFQVNYFRAWS